MLFCIVNGTNERTRVHKRKRKCRYAIEKSPPTGKKINIKENQTPATYTKMEILVASKQLA